ncbi:MAG: T9SS type A sorting domain-containing protein [Bacteroidota bacterium]
MKKFLYCLLGLILPFSVLKTSAQEPNAKLTAMVKVYGTVGTTTPFEAQNTQFTKVMFYPYDKVTLKPGPPDAIRSVVPYGYIWQDDFKSNSYTIEISDEYFYKVKLVQTARMNGEGSCGYRATFYQKTYDITESFLVDVSAQPFLGKIGLMPADWLDYDPTTSIYGKVQDENNASVLSHVTAYRIDANTNGIDTLTAYTGKDTVNSDYSIRFIPQGEYILRVQPMDTLHEEGYYNEVEGIVSAWQEATRISITELDKIEKKIVLKLLKSAASGKSDVSGMITGWKTGNNTLESMKGVRVYLKDESSQIKYITYTDNKGYFKIGNIAEGKYKIFADKPGYSMKVYNFESTKEGNSLVLDGIMNAGSITSAKENEPVQLLKGEIYPNPATTDQAIVKFDAGGKDATLRVITILGQEVLKTTFKTTEGANMYKLDVKQFPVGTYTVIISTGEEIIQMPPLHVVR